MPKGPFSSCRHHPLNRQTEIFGRHGLPIHRSTLCDWIGETAELLGPIVRAMKREILASGYVNTDDTPVRIHLGKESSGRTKEGRIWIYASPELRQAVYDFTTSREGEGPRRFLHGFAGFLQADAYSGYDRLFEDGVVVEVGCMAHCRRKFFASGRVTLVQEIDPAKQAGVLIFVPVYRNGAPTATPAKRRSALHNRVTAPSPPKCSVALP